MRLNFTKMHGLGNDFVLLDALPGSHPDTLAEDRLPPQVVRALGDRRRGIGFDQMLVARPPIRAGADVRMEVFNADGSRAQQCGNGLRCFARFVSEAGRVAGSDLRIETPAGILDAALLADDAVRVEMGRPRLAPEEVPFVADREAPSYTLDVGDRRVAIGAVSMGNPHAVLRVDDVDSAPVEELGVAVQGSPRFPEGVNVGFAQLVSRDRIRLRVFERGVGETLACGTGACAAAVVGQVQGRLGPEVRVDLPGGSARVEWPGPGHSAWLTGPTARVFDGSIEL